MNKFLRKYGLYLTVFFLILAGIVVPVLLSSRGELSHETLLLIMDLKEFDSRIKFGVAYLILNLQDKVHQTISSLTGWGCGIPGERIKVKAKVTDILSSGSGGNFHYWFRNYLILDRCSYVLQFCSEFHDKGEECLFIDPNTTLSNSRYGFCDEIKVGDEVEFEGVWNEAHVDNDLQKFYRVFATPLVYDAPASIKINGIEHQEKAESWNTTCSGSII